MNATRKRDGRVVNLSFHRLTKPPTEPDFQIVVFYERKFNISTLCSFSLFYCVGNYARYLRSSENSIFSSLETKEKLATLHVITCVGERELRKFLRRFSFLFFYFLMNFHGIFATFWCTFVLDIHNLPHNFPFRQISLRNF